MGSHHKELKEEQFLLKDDIFSNTYGCAWFEDRIEWYFNGGRIREQTSPPVLFQTLNSPDARPFGLICSNHVNRIAEADIETSWTEQLLIDWIHVWE